MSLTRKIIEEAGVGEARLIAFAQRAILHLNDLGGLPLQRAAISDNPDVRASPRPET